METFGLVTRARAFAIAAHEAVGQRRKYTGEPYWQHPARVADLVATAVFASPMLVVRGVAALDTAIAAAWLHDVVEDTQIHVGVIDAEFGSAVASIVHALTDTPAGQGNRAARKALDRARLASASPETQTIKVADLIDNTSSIVQHDPGFARIYMAEKRALLSVLTAADSDLLQRAWQIVADYEISIKNRC